MTLELILNSLLPLLRDGESAAITESDTADGQMIAVEGAARKANIYDFGGTYEWYSQPDSGAWTADDTDAMGGQLLAMLDCARTAVEAGDPRDREAQEMTPRDLIEQLSDLLAGGAPVVTGRLPDGTMVAGINYGPGELHIEKDPQGGTFSAWATTHSHSWRASKRDQTEARAAIADILAVVKPAS